MSFRTRFLRAAHLFILPLCVLLVSLAACASDPPDTPTPFRTPRPTRTPSNLKVARLEPTDTATPTITPSPTHTPLPTATDTATPTHTPVPENTRAPLASAASSTQNNPPTSSPTITITPPPDNPLPINAACDQTGGSDYGVLGAGGTASFSPETHADYNLAVRGYKLVNAMRGLVDYTGDTDYQAPQLWGLFADRRTPEIAHTYQVYDWDWKTNTRGDVVQDFKVTMVGFAVSDGESIYTPDFGKQIGDGYVAVVLYADPHRVTLKYTSDDNVIVGYTIHLEGVCVYANLLNLYNARQAAGRGALPALRPGQPIGYVPGTEFGVAIRDDGAFLDPRSRKDWWHGR